MVEGCGGGRLQPETPIPEVKSALEEEDDEVEADGCAEDDEDDTAEAAAVTTGAIK